MNEYSPLKVEFLPVDSISVINPRTRSPQLFNGVVTNIERVGIKRPITVTRRQSGDGKAYDLVCGQGRLEACQILGESKVPALIVDATPDDCLIMSLVENCARRKHSAVDLLREIGDLNDRGYAPPEIAAKTGLSADYVRGVLRLLSAGEFRLLMAVESGKLPLSVAIDIAESSDGDMKAALQRAYETNQLRGRKLLRAKRVIELRERQGKGMKPSGRKKPLSSKALLQAFRDDAEQKRALIRKSGIARDQLAIVSEALRRLLVDQHFVTLLRAETLADIPSNLAERIQKEYEESR